MKNAELAPVLKSQLPLVLVQIIREDKGRAFVRGKLTQTYSLRSD